MRGAKLYSGWAAYGRGQAPSIMVDYTLYTCEQQDEANPPTPCLVQITCTAEVWTAIQADPKYNGGIVASWII